MSYEKTTWQSGDIITAEKLNNIEQGIADNDFIMVTFEYRDSYVYGSHTPVEIAAFLEQGKNVYAKFENYGLVYASSNCIYIIADGMVVVASITFNFIGVNTQIEYIYAYDDGDSIWWKHDIQA